VIGANVCHGPVASAGKP